MFLLSAKVQVSFAVIKIQNWRYKTISDNRTEILNFRVSKEEKRMIEDKAFIKYDTLAPYLRDCALDKEILVIPGLSGIQDELNAIGNNLNQLTRAVNMVQTNELIYLKYEKWLTILILDLEYYIMI